MNRIDELINETLTKEDEALLASFGKEPSYFHQAMALFSGKLGWAMWLVGIVQLLLFVAAMYALYKAFIGDELMSVLRWGIGAVVLVQLSALLRSFMGMQFEANRVLREIKRLELRLVRLEEGRGHP